MICLFSASASEPQTPAQNIDYNFARDELMLNELSNDPIQAAISRLEKQHEEDKQGLYYFYHCASAFIKTYGNFSGIRKATTRI